MNDRFWTAAAGMSGIGTLVAAITPSDIVVWAGGLSTLGLGAIALYAKFRDSKRDADVKDAQVFTDLWRTKCETAELRMSEANTRAAQWEKLYKAARRPPTLMETPDPDTVTGSGSQSAAS